MRQKTMDAMDWQIVVGTSAAASVAAAFITFITTRTRKDTTVAILAEDAASAVKELNVRWRAHEISDAAAFARLEVLAAEASKLAIASELRLGKAIDELGIRFDRMAIRLDTVLSKRHEEDDDRGKH